MRQIAHELTRDSAQRCEGGLEPQGDGARKASPTDQATAAQEVTRPRASGRKPRWAAGPVPVLRKVEAILP